MHTIRHTLTVVALAAAGVAQASEITEFPLEPGTRSRAEVRAEAQSGRSQGPGELYDGRRLATPASAGMPKTREQVRLEARTSMPDAAMRNDRVGGM